MSEARFAIGIDLGTTHCVLAAVDLQASDLDEICKPATWMRSSTGSK